jgi:hypothetical protein
VGVSLGIKTRVGVAVGVGVSVAVGVGVRVYVGLGVGVSVAVGVMVGVGVGVLVAVAVAVGVIVGVLVAVNVGVSVWVAVGDGESVGVAVTSDPNERLLLPTTKINTASIATAVAHTRKRGMPPRNATSGLSTSNGFLMGWSTRPKSTPVRPDSAWENNALAISSIVWKR